MGRWRLVPRLELFKLELELELARREDGLANCSMEPQPESDEATEGSQLWWVQLPVEFSRFLRGINLPHNILFLIHQAADFVPSFVSHRESSTARPLKWVSVASLSMASQRSSRLSRRHEAQCFAAASAGLAAEGHAAWSIGFQMGLNYQLARMNPFTS